VDITARGVHGIEGGDRRRSGWWRRAAGAGGGGSEGEYEPGGAERSARHESILGAACGETVISRRSCLSPLGLVWIVCCRRSTKPFVHAALNALPPSVKTAARTFRSIAKPRD